MKRLIVATVFMVIIGVVTLTAGRPRVIDNLPEHAEPGWRKQDDAKFVHWYRELVCIAEAKYHDNFRGNEARFKCAYWSGATPEQALRLFYLNHLPDCEQ